MTFRPPANLLPVDFKSLADQYPNLAKYVHRTKSGVYSLDFKNPKALRELSVAVLWVHFQLRLEVPLDTLVPPIPNRLGYVCWTEYLTNGTGASCIYPLLACRRNASWKFLALDIDSRQVDYATENVKKNSFTGRISVVLNEENTSILPSDLISETRYEFCMCNPPFYRNATEIQQSRASKSESPSAICTGSRTEMITEGGELEFLKRLLKESLNLNTSIRWFSSLIGRREDYDLFFQHLDYTKEKEGLELLIETAEFANGKTVRWGIAWSIPSKKSSKRRRRIKKID
ncbi:S-adenosyl-L-methionine dependent methyltransferase [Rhizoclosmatium globosum]|uniref:S-adenosyl-L-methionine dependent methyltransferase n=1 Tax=Rhizoclosmatium globosum TaxID=329046 RepID=A0A1Y2CHY1_9FUNG|nr:S-adenosyl-L-methionine dependent methyltransferase [Rhizoclosmatium globosum]|eukprot:ORY46517.1 S-adenosyl-L-methionine dependent methyltransferase [Rhizoclosmatium globosum]